MFKDAISPFFSNHFEVAEVLNQMAKLTDHEDDIQHWQQLVPRQEEKIRHWFDQRGEKNGHKNFFAGSAKGPGTTGFWHMRSKHFPREYARKMVDSWALDKQKGFLDEEPRPFPRTKSKQSASQFTSQANNAFGYTPDTAYFVLDGMFRQRLEPATRLTLNHLTNYNFHPKWNIPVAPEAYRRDGTLFGDQYSNFNAGKILLFLEGIAGLEYSIPDRTITIRDAMPRDWEWMELRMPIRLQDEEGTRWPRIRYERANPKANPSIQVTNWPYQVKLEE